MRRASRRWLEIAALSLSLAFGGAKTAEAAPPRPRRLPYAAGRALVSYKNTEAVPTASSNKRKKPLPSRYLEQLHRHFVRSITPVFGTDDDRLHGPLGGVAALQSASAAQAPRVNLESIFLLQLSPETTVEEFCKLYAADSATVAFCEPDYIQRVRSDPLPNVRFLPNDPALGREGEWSHRREKSYPDLWHFQRIQVLEAWDTFPDPLRAAGKDVVVAVIDSGVDYNHQDLAANVWSNPAEIPNNAKDDDANGFKDDVRGWDFTTCAAFNDQNACVQPKQRDNDPTDDNGHGTAVAGVIAAMTDNGHGLPGIAPASKIMALKALAGGGGGYTSDIVGAIYYAARNGAKVINMSFGCESPCPPIATEVAAIQEAYQQGAIVVIAAGNNHEDIKDYFPENMTTPKPIVVAASTPDETPAPFSSVGTLLDLSAPGVEVLVLKSNESPDTAIVVGGTSFAAPQVAGVAALLRSRHPDVPDDPLTGEDVRRVLRESADDIGAVGVDRETGMGRLNAAHALLLANRAPTMRLIPSPQRVRVGQPLMLKVDALDPDVDLLTYGMSGAPLSALINAQTGDVRFTPTPAHAGQSYHVTFTATDLAGASASQGVTIQVEALWGDLNADGQVTVDEVVAAVNAALGSAALSPEQAARVDRDRSGQVTIDELLAAVNNALNGPAAEGTVRMLDRNRNRRVESLEFVWFLGHAPQVKIITPLAGSMARRDIVVEAQVVAEGPLKRVDCSLNDSSVRRPMLTVSGHHPARYRTPPWPWRLLRPAANTFTVRATDQLGRVGQAIVQIRR